MLMVSRVTITLDNNTRFTKTFEDRHEAATYINGRNLGGCLKDSRPVRFEDEQGRIMRINPDHVVCMDLVTFDPSVDADTDQLFEENDVEYECDVTGTDGEDEGSVPDEVSMKAAVPKSQRRIISDAIWKAGIDAFIGRGAPYDRDKGLKFIRRAAELGNPYAAIYYGYALCNGWYGESKHEEGIQWVRSARTDGDPYLTGAKAEYLYRLDPESANLSWELCRQSAEGGDLKSMFRYGLYYRRYDQSIGWDWIMRSAQAGFADACFFIGSFKIFQTSLFGTYGDAMDWIKKAKSLGCPWINDEFESLSPLKLKRGWNLINWIEEYLNESRSVIYIPESDS